MLGLEATTASSVLCDGTSRTGVPTGNESGKVVFWGWGQHHSKGRSPIQANGIVEYTPHFLTGYVDGGAVNSLETSVLTLSDDTLTIEVFDTFTSTRTQFFSFNLPEPAN